MTPLLKKIAIIGRPNVGKSTLFNRLSKQRKALVEDRPGVTRDWQETAAQLFDLKFTIVDTAGLEGFESSEIFQQILFQNERIIAHADIILFMIDGLEGVLPSDVKLADQLRRVNKPVILIVNKAENARFAIGLREGHRLGLGEPLALSAVHGEGLDSLYYRLQPLFPDEPLDEPLSAGGLASQDEPHHIDDQDDTDQSAEPLSLVIVGRPNAGKSTLVNRLIGQERLVASDQPGITRDSITIDWHWKNHPIKLVDTAGIRRRAKVDDQLEQAAVSDALQAIRFAHVIKLTLTPILRFLLSLFSATSVKPW